MYILLRCNCGLSVINKRICYVMLCVRKIAVPVDCFDCFKCTNDVCMDLSRHQQCIDKYYEDIVNAVATAATLKSHLNHS